MKLLLPLIFTVFIPCLLQAQEDGVSTSETDPRLQQRHVYHSVVPVFGYKSDSGLIGGGVWQRIDYGDRSSPFRSATSLQMTASTMGHLSGKLNHDWEESFGTGIRSQVALELLRIPNQTFFGIGNDTGFDVDSYEEGYYEFLERSARLSYRGRQRLLETDGGGRLDLLLLAVLGYSDPKSAGDDTLLEQTRPSGYRGGWTNRAGGGVIFDRRDSEFNPRSGYRLETALSGAAGLTGSDYRFGIIETDLRGYLPIGSATTLAQRLEVRTAFGDTPFQELPTIGNEQGLRGFVLNRFRGNATLLHQAELRSWLFSMMDGEIRVGAHLFHDVGRVFDDGDRLGDLTEGLKRTWGVGGAFSLFSPDFIFRGELGFSEELYRIYVGVGYLF